MSSLNTAGKGHAIVTDGFWRKSLSAIRALGKAGYAVTVLGDSVFTTGFWSRFTTCRWRCPSAATSAEAFRNSLLHRLQAFAGGALPVLFPMEDASLMLIAENVAEFGRFCRFLLPPWESLLVAQDKGETAHLAAQIGLPAPRSLMPANPDELIKVLADLPFHDAMVKPRYGRGAAGNVYNPVLPAEEWRRHWKRYGPLLVQERIPAEGRGLGVSLLMDADGICVAQFAHERLRQYPVSGGPSTDRRSILAPELIEMSLALTKKLRWRGIVMVEWKLDPRDNCPKLMEINPRFWGSLELAVRAGVNFPVLYARAACAESLPPPPSYSAGVRCRWLVPGDILRYLSSPAPDRESLAEFLRDLRLAEEWDPEDVRGGLALLACTGAQALNPHYWKYLRR
jgi:predicted ATP-grasp superfamily ATP-dependent carboligase